MFVERQSRGECRDCPAIGSPVRRAAVPPSSGCVFEIKEPLPRMANVRLTRASTVLLKGRHKLLNFCGYADKGIDELVTLYGVEADPEELADLSTSKQDIASELLADLKSKLKEVDQPYL
jgi:hypothetical protein